MQRRFRGDGPMEKQPSVRMIAELAHVSVATVSRVINGQKGVDEATRALVWKTIREVGYEVVRHPDVLSGVLVFAPHANFLDNTYWRLVVSGILHEASLLSIPVLFSSAMTQTEARAEISSMMSREGVPGVIFVGFPIGASVSEWVPRHLDVVWVSVLMDAPGHVVNADTRRAYYEATRRLIDLGHRRIAMTTNGVAYLAPYQRVEGYVAACEDAGVEPFVARIAPPVKAGDWLRGVLASPDPPTAVVGGTSGLSKHLFAEMINMKLDLPEDLSFLGIGHGPEVEEPLYDRIDQPTFELGIHAVRTLRKAVARPGRADCTVLLPTETTLIGTTGPPQR